MFKGSNTFAKALHKCKSFVLAPISHELNSKTVFLCEKNYNDFTTVSMAAHHKILFYSHPSASQPPNRVCKRKSLASLKSKS